jgi:hypothetical protein
LIICPIFVLVPVLRGQGLLLSKPHPPQLRVLTAQ